MKKSKILMPLTGIAAIGAVAPVIAMTSCGNKNEFKLFETYELQDKGTIGFDEANGKSGKQFGVTGKLSFVPEDGNIVTHAWDAQEDTNKFLHVAGQQETPVDGKFIGGSRDFEVEAGKFINLTFNSAKSIKDETINIPVTYKIYDKTGGKVIHSCVVTFTFQVFKERYSVAKLDTSIPAIKAVGSAAKIADRLAMSGLTLQAPALDGLKIELLADDLTAVNDDYKLTIDKSTEIAKEQNAISFKADLYDKEGKKVTTVMTNPTTFTTDATVKVKFTDTKGKYVLPSWEDEFTIPSSQITAQILA